MKAVLTVFTIFSLFSYLLSAKINCPTNEFMLNNTCVKECPQNYCFFFII